MTPSSPRTAHLRAGLGFVLAVLGGCEFKLGELEPGGTTGSGDTSTSTSTSTTGVDDDTEATPYGSTTAELPQPPGCCAPHAEPGCVDDEIATCVCEFDRFCCTNEWDDRCVDRIAELGCGVCNGNEGSCCEKSRSPGCGDADVQSCVCKLDPFCCTDRWDEACVERVGALGCGVCEGDETEGGTKPSATCCEPGGVGCVDLDIEACVCSQDEYCCSTGWDDVCVSKVEALGCGDCGSGPYDIDDCCSADDGICSDPLIAGCVCSQLPECCEGPWTDNCVAAIDLLGCGSCPPSPEAESSSGFESESSSTSG